MRPQLVIGNKNYSSWSLRPWLAARHAGIEFDEVRVALYTLEGVARLQQLSPSGKAPVWNTARFICSENSLIPGVASVPTEPVKSPALS